MEIALPAILGLALLGLALPRTVSAWARLEAQPVFEKFDTGQPPTTEELAEGRAGLDLALRWWPSSIRLVEAARVEFASALALAPDDPRRGAFLEQAEGHLAESLRYNPADGLAWLILAQVRLLRGAGGEQIAAALIQSVDMAPNYRLLWGPRAALLLRHWRYLDEAQFHVLQRHLRAIWATSPGDRGRLLEVAQEAGELGVTAAAVGEDSISVAAFEAYRAELGRRAGR